VILGLLLSCDEPTRPASLGVSQALKPAQYPVDVTSVVFWFQSIRSPITGTGLTDEPQSQTLLSRSSVTQGTATSSDDSSQRFPVDSTIVRQRESEAGRIIPTVHLILQTSSETTKQHSETNHFPNSSASLLGSALQLPTHRSHSLSLIIMRFLFATVLGLCLCVAVTGFIFIICPQDSNPVNYNWNLVHNGGSE
jgi:hypothetical protein